MDITALFITIAKVFLLVSGNSINEIHIRTFDTGSTNVWNTPDIYKLNTKLSNYGIPEIPGNEKDFIFKVKAISDAYLLLSRAYDLISPNFIEIVLGGGSNVNSHVWYKIESGDIYNSQPINTPGVLSDVEYRKYNISWREGDRLTITDDGGKVWVDFMSPINISVKGIGLRSGWGYDADWIIPITVMFTGHYLANAMAYANMTTLEEHTIHNVFMCSMQCSLNPLCLGFNFNHLDEYCHLIAGNQIVVKIARNGWSFYTKCLQNKSMCLNAID